MFFRVTGFSIIIILLLIISLVCNLSFNNLKYGSLLEKKQVSNYRINIALIPLDSRPACTQFVQQIARIANINVIIPPEELLDNYNTPGNAVELRQWLLNTVSNCDAAIVSIDMLIHGSLLESRKKVGTTQDSNEVLALLQLIKQRYPNIKLYVFNIIPRLLIADDTENVIYKNKMLNYSVLKDQVDIFENPYDTDRLNALEQQIPSSLINKYVDMYEQNIALNVSLTKLVEQNILSYLVIGQDDGQPFGIPNTAKQRIQQYILRSTAINKKVMVTRGTDEIALTLLGRLISDELNYKPRIYVEYSDNTVAGMIMPFMPHSIDTTANEKIELINGIRVYTPQDSSYILFIHAGNHSNRTKLSSAAVKLKKLLSDGYKVALVDLSENYQASETLLPFLLNTNQEISNLIAYAGWNTTSNSVGTAVTQSLVVSGMMSKTTNEQELLDLFQSNFSFLVARFLDDWYYLKDIQPHINQKLRQAHINQYKLNDSYHQTDQAIRKMVTARALHLHNYLKAKDFVIITDNGPIRLVLQNLQVKTYLPWERTFEVWLEPDASFIKLGKSNI